MNLIEFLAFIVSFGFFIFLIFKRAFENWKGRRHPSHDREEERDDGRRLKQFLKSLDEDMDALDEEEEEEEEEKKFVPMKKPQMPPLKPAYAPPRTSSAPSTPPSITFITKVEKQAPMDDRFAGKQVVSSHYTPLSHHDPYSLSQMKNGTSRAYNLLRKLPSKQEMVILHEIIDRPKSLKPLFPK